MDLNKIREERAAREKARILKLRELNLQKYAKQEFYATTSNQPQNCTHKAKPAIANQDKNSVPKNEVHMGITKNVKNNFHLYRTTKRLISAPSIKSNILTKDSSISSNVTAGKTAHYNFNPEGQPVASTSYIASRIDSKQTTKSAISKSNYVPVKSAEANLLANSKFDSNKAGASDKLHKTIGEPKPLARKWVLPTLAENSKTESDFDRLYKLRTDTNYLKKNISNSELITNMRQSVSNEVVEVAPRRSLFTVFLKSKSKSEAANCIHKWASIGDNINELDLGDNEDDKVKRDSVVSAIKSEQEKAKFFTAVPSNFNTPSFNELQSRLISWLQKCGKSLESYHHLQCFGVHHLKTRLDIPKHISFVDGDLTPIAKNSFEITVPNFDEANEETIELDSDSDDCSFLGTMAKPIEPTNKSDIDNLKRAKDTECVGFNESTNFNETSITSADTLASTDDLLIGALNDLSALLREGFDWQLAARWLRSIRDRFPLAPRFAAYWECRAALESSRGDLSASVKCWEEAIDKGTKCSVVESNLDQMLDNFMQLKKSPSSGARRQLDPKLVEVKNVFKNIIIRFAMQQANLRRKLECHTTPSCMVTPVRRSERLSHSAIKTPVQFGTIVKHAASIAPYDLFTPIKNVVNNP